LGIFSIFMICRTDGNVEYPFTYSRKNGRIDWKLRNKRDGVSSL